MTSALREEQITATTEFVSVCDACDLWDGEMDSFDIGEYEVLLLKFNGQFRAYDGICPHQSVSLVEGDLTHDGVLICRAHQWQFNAASGLSINPANECLKRFPVKVENGVVLVGTQPLANEENLR
jgi:nitrite reductase/ring-hydroxylating ferredoxin subunit